MPTSGNTRMTTAQATRDAGSRWVRRIARPTNTKCTTPTIKDKTDVVDIAVTYSEWLVAPLMRQRWATDRTTVKWYRQILRNQNLADIPAVHIQIATATTEIAIFGAFGSRQAGTRNALET